MNISCGVIQDLLPLYVEKMTSSETNSVVEEHLVGCSSCAERLALAKVQLTKNKTDKECGASLKIVRKNIQKRKAKAIAFAALLVFLIMFTVFSYLTKPNYISYKDSNITLSKTQDQKIYADFSERVTSYKIMKYTSADHLHVMEIEAWTSVWDRLLGKSNPSVLLSSPDSKVDTVYYCDYSSEDNNMTVIYGTNPNADGGIIALPRLFLGAYFTIAVAAAAGIGFIWAVFRKTRAKNIFMYLFFVPTSYLISHLLLSTSFVSFSAARDFNMILIAAAAIYGISILGISLIQQHKKDRRL